MMKNPFKLIWITIGFISLGIGIVGIFIPILPTVPFLFLTLFCFANGSEKLKKWFLQTNIYKKHLENYKKNRAMTVNTKIKVSLSLTLGMGFGFIMMSRVPIARIILAVIWFAHIIYFVFGVKTISKDKEENERR